MPIFSTLGDRESRDLFVGHVPELVGFVAEVFQADPDLRWIGDHVRAPVVEDLQAADQHVGLLDVDPGVLERPAVGLGDSEAIDQQAHGDEVAIDQAVARCP